jgi:hypothetical protein
MKLKNIFIITLGLVLGAGIASAQQGPLILITSAP